MHLYFQQAVIYGLPNLKTPFYDILTLPAYLTSELLNRESPFSEIAGTAGRHKVVKIVSSTFNTDKCTISSVNRDFMVNLHILIFYLLSAIGAMAVILVIYLLTLFFIHCSPPFSETYFVIGS